MDTVHQFTCREFDDVSALSTLHFSYIVQNLIPLSVLDRNKIAEFDKALEENQEVGMFEDIIPVAVGSTSEGLNMPNFIEITDTGSRSLDLSDLDILQVLNQYTITFNESEKPLLRYTNGIKELFPWEFFALAETNGIHPGYVRLNRSNTTLFDEYQDREMLLLRFRMDHFERNSREFVDMIEVNGPALTIPVSFSDRKMNGKPLPLDKVLAMPCQEWPPTANSFKERFKDNDWIQKGLLKMIIECGCHIVPVHHRLAIETRCKEEWRISFATSERLIAREALTDFQRQAYIAIKIIYHQKLKKLDLLSSYHMKTVFFFACERINTKSWRENMGTCMLYFFDVLIECVRKGNIPSFFIPENNLIDYLTEEELTILEKEVTDIRTKPLDQLLAFFDNKYLEEIGVKLDYRDIFSPVISDMEFYCELRNFDLSLKEVLRPCSIRIMVNYIESGNYKEAIMTAKHVHFLNRKFASEKEALAKLVLSAALEIENRAVVLDFFRYLIEKFEEEDAFDCCKSYLRYLEQQEDMNKSYCCVM